MKKIKLIKTALLACFVIFSLSAVAFALYNMLGGKALKPKEKDTLQPREETAVQPDKKDPSLDYSYYEGYVSDPVYQEWLTEAIDALKEDGIKDTESTGLMILERYDYYLEQIRNNKAFIGYNGRTCSEIYLYYAFYSMMREDVVDRISENVNAGKDGLDGFTGLFERPYYSEYDNRLDSYIIYLPKDYDASKKYPMVVFLHGYGGCCYSERTATEDDAFMKNCEEKDVILICPNGRHRLPYDNSSYMGYGMKDVLQTIDDAKTYYSVDESRVYLTGFSMGGWGTWYISSIHPELFAAIAPLCAYVGGSIDMTKLKDIPVYAFHGSDDHTVPKSDTEYFVNELQEAGGNVTYLELEGYDHNIWDRVYEEMDLLEWFLQYKK